MPHPKPKKKILYIITKSNWGGAQRYVHDLAVNIPPDRFSVSVAFGGSGLLEKRLIEKGIRIIRIPSLKYHIGILSDLKAFIAIIKMIHTEKPDILHLNSSKAGILGAVAGYILRVPRVLFTGHGWAFHEERSKISKKIVTYAHAFTIYLCHETIAVCKKVKDTLPVSEKLKQKITVIHNGIESPTFFSRKEARAKLKEKFPPLSHTPNNAIWIGTVSELHQNKGLDFLIRALKHVKETRRRVICVVLGEGKERNELATLARSLGVSEHLYLPGFVPNASSYISAFDIFTLTSRTEAFPYALLEASSAGVPIVASRIGGIPEIIADLKTGVLIQKGDVTAIAETLDLFLKNMDEATQLGTNAKKRMLREFRLKDMVEKTIRVYER